MRKIFVFLIILSGIFSFTGVYGQKPGTSGAEFLKLPAGARQAGIGGTFVGIGDDVNSLFWNPGGLATLKTWGFSAMHSEWLADLRFDSFGLAIPVFGRKNVVGAMAGILSMPSWDNTGGVEPAVSAQDLYAGVAFARNVWPKIYVGGAVKYIRRKLADFAAGAIACDIGAIYKYSDWLTFGGSAQNYGGRIKFIKNAASLPFVLRGGASIRPFFGKPFDIIFAADGIYYLNEDIRQICLGSELNLFHLLNIRAGYRIDKTLLSMSSGLGIKYGMFNLDYAYNPFEKKISGFFHALSTHQISLTIRSISPIPFVSYYPGPAKRSYLKKKKLWEKVKRLLGKETKPKKLMKLKQQESELTNFFEENKTLHFYLEPRENFVFKWQESYDPDPGDSVYYRILYKKVNIARDQGLEERLKKLKTGSQLCNSANQSSWFQFEHLDNDTIQCVISQKDSSVLPAGQYAWWVEAFDQNGHIRELKDHFRLVDIKYTKPPQLKEPVNQRKIKMKWQKKKGTSGEMTPKEEIPGGGVAESFQTREEQWVTSYPVSFQWSPAVLGFGDQQVILQIYDDYNAEAPLIKVIVTGRRTKTFTISLSRGGKVGVRCKSDSSVVVDIPILAYSKEFFWQVVARDLESAKEKSSKDRWSFTLLLEQPKILISSPKTLANLSPDTLYTEHMTIESSDIPIVPIFFFQEKSSQLDRDSQNYLDTLRTTLTTLTAINPDVQLLISGYCDRESDGNNFTFAKQLAKERAETVKRILVGNRQDLENRIVVRNLRRAKLFSSRVHKIPELNLDRKKIQAENRRVELKVFIKDNAKLQGFDSFENFLVNSSAVATIKKILKNNRNVIAIIKGANLNQLYRYKKRLVRRIRFANKIYTIEAKEFAIELSGDKIIYRPLPPKRILAEYGASSLHVKIDKVQAPSPFDWKLEISSAEMNTSGRSPIFIGEGTIKSNYQDAAWPVDYRSEQTFKISRNAAEKYLLILTVTPLLGGQPVQFTRPLEIKYTEYEQIRERKIIIQYYFDSVVAESEFLETQVEDFAKKLMTIKPGNVSKIMITGHTCNIGNQRRNITLSEQRAKKVMDSLIRRLQLNVNKNRASAWIHLLRGQYEGLSYWKPYNSGHDIYEIDNVIKLNASEVEPQNRTPRMRSINRRAQVDIIHRK